MKADIAGIVDKQEEQGGVIGFIIHAK